MPALTQAQRRIHDAALRLFAERGVTQVNVTDLAQAAGVARGTIYNNLGSPEALFEEIAAGIAHDMNERLAASFGPVTDPAARLALGMRLYIRRAHEEPHWARFFCRFAFSNASLQRIWEGQPVADLRLGLQQGRFHFAPEQLPSVASLIGGAVLGGSFMVLDGLKTWRDAAADTGELVLVALGIPRDEARELASAELGRLSEPVGR